MAFPDNDVAEPADVAAFIAAAEEAIAAEDIALARAHAGEALQRTAGAPAQSGHARALQMLAQCDLAVGRVERAYHGAREAAEGLARHGDREAEIAALALAARAGARAGRLLEAVESGLGAVALSEALPAGLSTVLALGALGEACTAGLQFDSAQRALRSALAGAQALGSPALLADILTGNMMLQLTRHVHARGQGASGPELQALLELADQARALEAEGRTGGMQRRTLTALIALSACLTGDIADALRRIERPAPVRRAGLVPHWSAALDAWARLELCWHTNNVHGATVYAAQVGVIADAAQHAPLRLIGLQLAAGLHEDRGDTASALVERKAELEHERAARARDLESRSIVPGARTPTRRRTGAPSGHGPGWVDQPRWCSELAATAQGGHAACVALFECLGPRDPGDETDRVAAAETRRLLAERLQRDMRARDLVTHLSEPEFGVVLRDTEPAQARAICQRVVKALAIDGVGGAGLLVDVQPLMRGDSARSVWQRLDHALADQRLLQAAPPPGAPEAPLRLARVLRNARRVVLLCGDAEATDAWAPAAQVQPPVDDEAGWAAFHAAWALRSQAVRQAAPGPRATAVQACARTLYRHRIDLVVVTDAIEGAMLRAAVPRAALPGTVHEREGSLLRARCAACGATTDGAFDLQAAACEVCGQRRWRPDLRLADERPDARVATAAALALQQADAVLCLGHAGWTDAAVLGRARARGAWIVRLGDGGDTVVASEDLCCPGAAAPTLEAACARLDAELDEARSPTAPGGAF